MKYILVLVAIVVWTVFQSYARKYAGVIGISI